MATDTKLRWRVAVLACVIAGQLTGSGTSALRAQTCLFTQGYWKTHASAWPVRTLQLGNPARAIHTYSQPALLSILAMSAKGDASITLATQLIAAKLNIASGAYSAAAVAAVAHADALLAVFNRALPYGVKSSTPVGVDMTSTASLLEDFNSGRLSYSCGGGNLPPTANAGPDQTVPVGTLVTLSGAASSDPNGDALTFVWTMVNRPAGSAATLSNPSAVNPTFVVDLPGSYTVQLIVRDGQSSSAPDTVIISRNSAPVANAGGDQTVRVGDVVRLDGSASTDADGDQLAFHWSLITRPAGSQAAFVDSSAIAPSFTVDLPGTYVATLVVRDAQAAGNPDLVSISTQNSPPVANAGTDIPAQVGETITLNGTTSSDVDGDALQYAWSTTSRPAGSTSSISDAAAVQPTFVIDRPGSFVFQLIVNDGVDSAADSVTVSTTNSRPVANAGVDRSVFVDTPTQLDGSGSSDVDGNTLTYAWSLTVRPEGSLATLTDPAAVNPTLVADLPGSYVAQLIVDDGVLASDPDTVQLTTENRPPIADPGIAQTAPLGATVTLDGTASADPDGDAITYQWSLLARPGGSNAQLANPTTAQPTFVADVRGNYVAQLIVSDNASSSAPRSVTISTENSAPIANAGPDQSASVGATILLDGTASIDPDGTPLQYSWSLLSLPAGSQTVLSNPTGAAPSFVADRVGTYVAQLIVNDGALTSQPDALTVTITNNADLSIAIVNPPSGTIAPGTAVAFAIRIENLGPLDAHSVAAQFQLPAGYTGTVTPAAGSYGQAGEWLVGDLAAGASAQLAVQATVNQIGELALTAAVSGSDRTDPESANNTANADGPVRPAATNHAPVITSLPSATGAVGVLYAYDVVAVDPDQNDTLAFSLPIAPQGMTIDSGTGRVRWTPLGNQSGPISVAVHVRDLAGQLAAQGFTITVSPGGANQAPLATDDHYDARTGDSLSVAAPGVLANDSDPDGNRLSARLLSQPANGTAILNADGSLIYTPFSFQPGETVTADRVNLAVALPGSVTGGISGSSDAASAFDVNLASFWRSGIANTALNGSRDRELPYVEITFPQDVTPIELQATGTPASSFGKVLAGRFQMFDAAGDELFDGGILDLPAPEHDGKQSIPELFNRRRNAARQPGAIYRGSSSHTTLPPAQAFDGNILTAWQTPDGAPQFVEVELATAITLHQVNVFGNRANTTADYVTYVVQGFNAAGQNVFDSGPVTTTAATSDRRISVNDVPGVTRVRVTGTVAEGGGQGGFSEVEVISTEASPTRLNDRVRRVRFTDTADEPGSVNQAFLAEVRVVGSTSIRREPIVETNLAFLLPATVRASSSLSGNEAENAIDDTVRNWYATQAVGDFLELEFPSLVTVTEIQSLRPSGTPQGFNSSLPIVCSGTFALLAEDGTSLFSSGVVNQPSGSLGGTAFVIAVPVVSNVKRMRFTSAGCSGSWPVGFDEVRVLGTSDATPTPIVAIKKYQSLFGLEVHSTPIVINLTDDNHDGAINHRDVPEIVVAVEDSANQLAGVLRVISGDDGRNVMTMGGPNLVSPWAEPAAADLDGDGRPEIIAVHSDRNHLIAFNADGTQRWISDAHAMPQFALGSGVATGAISIANLDNAGPPEIIVGASVFDAQGHVRGDGRTLGGSTGGLGLRSAISAVANIDLDGLPELVAGPTAYRLSAGGLTSVWQRSDRSDGYVAIGNLDDDPFAEIVIVANGTIYALNHDGTDAAVWNAPTHAPVSIPGGGQGGAPTLADVDGDGIPEIGVAGAGYYVVFNRDGSIRWKAVISDRTSNATGATVFDLDNDGSAEIIYRDEAHLRIFRGRDGVLLSKLAIGSSTWSEMPVVADVDNDGHADIVVTSDRFFSANNLGDTGVYVLTDVANRWARTRRVWNQHSYHVTNIDEDGAVPVVEPEHWLLPGLNSFRLNRLQVDRDDDGSDSFEYATSDGVAESDRAVVRVAVRTPNSAPQITSAGPTSAAVGVTYLYAVEALDPDAGDILTFSLTETPAGMSIDAASGLIRWTPTPAQRGVTRIVARVRDARGLFALQGVAITVGDPISVPNVVGQLQAAATTAITSAALTVGDLATRHSPTAAVGFILEQSPLAGILVAPASAVDLVVSLGPAPTGTIPRVIGMPQSAAVIDIAAAGFAAGAISGRFDAGIASGVVLEQSPIGGTIATAGSPIALIVSLGIPPADRDEDHDGFTGGQGDCNDANAAINPLAIDLPGDGIDQNCNGRDSIAGDTTPPVAALVSPDDLAAITMPTDIIGTATDTNFLRYTVQLAEVDATSFTTIGSGTAAATNAMIARLDPTLLENGLYRVRLVVEDMNGQTSVDERAFKIEGDAKPGQLHLSFTDLKVPVAGVPIVVTRTYDSRIKTTRDFGVGWTLDIKAGTYRHNRMPGDGWIIRDQPFIGQLLPCLGGSLETRSHLTEVRLSEREVYRFALEIGSPTLGIAGACEGRATFRYVDGTLPDATLEILDNADVLYLRGGPDQLLEEQAFLDGEERVFDPRRVRLTTIDGRSIELDRSVGTTRIVDANGHGLTITAAGILHSGGKSIAFDRDASGRIVRITDPSGHELAYAYEGENLIRFTDPIGAAITFEYDARHNLVAIRDAAGTRVMAGDYDAAGRLMALTNGAGGGTTFTHDLDGLEEIVTDSLGRSTRILYDAFGRVTTQESSVTIEGLLVPVRSQFEYDATGNETLTVDPDGVRVASTFENQRLLSDVLDPEGLAVTTRRTYDTRGEMHSITDPSGRQTTFAYDLRRNLTQIVDNAGNHLDLTYNASGLPTESRDALGHKRTVSLDGNGQVLQERDLDASGHVVSDTGYAYDANGNRVTRTERRTTTDGLQVLTTRYLYDARNKLVATIDPSGSVFRSEYNSIGRRSATVDALGRRTEFTYDTVGSLTHTRHPDGTEESLTYDSAGNVITAVDRGGLVTTFHYDELNRQVRVVRPDGTATQTVYTAGGQTAATIDARGNRTDFEYDAAGRQTRVLLPPVLDPETSAFGRPVIAREYEPSGRPRAIIDPNGHRTTFTYDDLGRLARRDFADGTSTSAIYDLRGRRTAAQDEAGRLTQFLYDTVGRLTRVVDAAGNATVYGYDETGLLTTQTDARGHTTRFRYDAAGRMISRQLPGGESETYTYDAIGNLVAHVDFSSRRTDTAFDAMNRLISRRLADGTSTTFSYTASGQRAAVSDARGVTRYAYDDSNQLARVEHPDGQLLRYTYDADGNLQGIQSAGATINYERDAINRLTAIDAVINGVSIGRTVNTYDRAGNQTSQTRPNQTSTRMAYDARNRLVSLAHLSGLTPIAAFDYSLSPTGRRTRLAEADGTVTTYGYDALDRLTSEVRQGSTSIAYEYDAVSNRVRMIKDGVVTNYAYDANDRLLSAGGSTFAYDATGNLLTRTAPTGTTTYDWSPDGKLTRTATPGVIAQYTYDADGNRVTRSVNGAVTKFVVDANNPTGLPQVIAEQDAGGADTAQHVFGNRLLGSTTAGGTSFTHTDALGSVRALTDAGGVVTDRYRYDGFGTTIARSGTTANPFLFAGEQFDETSGLYNLRARNYDPAVGRFLGRDPLLGVTADPRSQNPHLYAHADPVNVTDPTGLSPLAELFAAIGVQDVLRGLDVARTAAQYCAMTSNVEVVSEGLFWGQFAVAAPLLAESLFGAGEFNVGAEATVSAKRFLNTSNVPDRIVEAKVSLGGTVHGVFGLNTEFTRHDTIKLGFGVEYDFAKKKFSKLTINTAAASLGLGGDGPSFGLKKSFDIFKVEKCTVELMKGSLEIGGEVGLGGPKLSAAVAFEAMLGLIKLSFPLLPE